MRRVGYVAAVACLFAAASSSAQAQLKPLEIYWVDVEGGGATLIVTPGGESILIDAGEDLDRDAGRIAEVARKYAGLQKIDMAVATHWHADHYGGFPRLSKLIPVGQFSDHGNVPHSLYEDPSFPKLMPMHQKLTGGKSRALKAGDLIPLKNSAGSVPVTMECIASNKAVAPSRLAAAGANPACASKPPVKPDDTDNANSLAFKLSYGEFTFYDGGDLTRDIEEKLVCPKNLVGEVSLYQTDAHGMDVSNSAVFMNTLRPRVVVVNNGPRKGAEPETMKSIFAIPGIETVWQVHRNLGTSASLNTAPRYVANPDEKCSAQHLKALIKPDGSFVMQTAAGFQQRYGAKRKR
jgi:beta-lactamase superfamily II metal-dependent hydrolase